MTKQGYLMDTNIDALIVATALEHGLSLVSRDRDVWFAQDEYQVTIVKV